MNTLGRIVLTATRIVLILPAAAAIPTITSAQSTTPPATVSSASTLPLPPMPADANPSFDVATIKPSDTSAPHGTYFRIAGRHSLAYNISIGELIAYAYGVHRSQIVGDPSALLDRHFDIDGVPDIPGRPKLKQSQLMYQKLLVSRFKLAFHYESREVAAFAIQIAKGGPKLALTTRKPGDGSNFSYNCQAVLTARNVSAAEIAQHMQGAFLDKPVVDQTALQDRYDFDLKWTPDESQNYCPPDAARSRDDSNAAPGLYTAIQEQLGLKLVPTKAPLQVMVIDHVEALSEN